MSSSLLPPIVSQEKPSNPFSVTLKDQKKKSNETEDGNKTIWNTNKEVFSRTDRLAALLGNDFKEQKKTQSLKLSQTVDANANSLKTNEKESISDLITKKREMFLVQMSLDTKREEIRKLEEKAHLKEDALHRSEQMLEEDAIRFDAFLKENDKKAHDAIKKAEEETRKKQEKVFEIKRLTQHMQQLNSDIIKNKETLDECFKYKTFLDDLTPQQWVSDQKRINLDNMNDNDKVLPIYFTRTNQLMDIFASLEEQNLFLIQNSQETEQTLEELQNSYSQTKLMMENQSQQQKQQIDDLQYQITREKHRTENLKQKRLKSSDLSNSSINNNQNSIDENEEVLLLELNKKVQSVYEQCGFDSSSRPTTLFMLAQLESRLEVLLNEISLLPSEFVLKSEKEKEKKRRERKREEQQELFIQQQEERNRRAIERSMQAPKKRTGKTIMYRSRLVNNNEVKKETISNAEIDELKYMS